MTRVVAGGGDVAAAADAADATAAGGAAAPGSKATSARALSGVAGRACAAMFAGSANGVVPAEASSEVTVGSFAIKSIAWEAVKTGTSGCFGLKKGVLAAAGAAGAAVAATAGGLNGLGAGAAARRRVAKALTGGCARSGFGVRPNQAPAFVSSRPCATTTAATSKASPRRGEGTSGAGGSPRGMRGVGDGGLKRRLTTFCQAPNSRATSGGQGCCGEDKGSDKAEKGGEAAKIPVSARPHLFHHHPP